MTTLVTFLGRAPKNEGAYRTTVYTFPDGTRSGPVAFIGWPLQARLQAERLVILGTAGSMWDHLFEVDLQLGDVAEAARVALLDAVDRKAVERRHLAPLEPVLGERLGCEVRLQLIPYARTETEQVELLRIIAKQIRRGESVHLDVTHGFRHLPMLALLAALHLRLVKEAQIAGIWYGEFDPDTKQALVRDLSGLLHLADWLQALATYDKDGDYGVFAPLQGESGRTLRQAAFFERTTNPVKAKEKLGGWKDTVRGDPAYDLFRDELHRRLDWWKSGDRDRWEAGLARRYLAHGDYLRAAIYGLEALVSRQVREDGGDLKDFEAHDLARESLAAANADFKRLSRLRNAMAHGVRAFDRDILRLLADETRLAETLKTLFDRLLPS